MIGWSTLADAPEELAEQIRANVERIAALVGQQPERALADLSEQRRQLEVLIEADPNHPAIPEIDERIGALETSLADLEREHGEQIPQGHVALFVLEERLEVLKEQVAAMGRPGG